MISFISINIKQLYIKKIFLLTMIFIFDFLQCKIILKEKQIEIISINDRVSKEIRKNNDLIYKVIKSDFKLFCDKTTYKIIEEVINYFNLYDKNLEKKNKIQKVKDIFSEYKNFYPSSISSINILISKLDLFLNDKKINKDQKAYLLIMSILQDKILSANDIKRVARSSINSLENDVFKIFFWSLYIFSRDDSNYLNGLNKDILEKIFFAPINFNEVLKSLNNVAINDIYIKNIENNSLKSKNLLNQFLKEIVPLGLDIDMSIDIIERRKILINLLLDKKNKSEKDKIFKILKEIIEIENKIENFPKESIEAHLKYYIPPKNYFGFLPFVVPSFNLFPFKDYIVNFFNKDEKSSYLKYGIYSAISHLNPMYSQYFASESSPLSSEFYLKGFKKFLNIGLVKKKNIFGQDIKDTLGNYILGNRDATYDEFSNNLDKDKGGIHRFTEIISLGIIGYDKISLDRIAYKPIAFGLSKLTTLIQDTASMFQFGYNLYNIYSKSATLNEYYNNIMLLSIKSKEITNMIEKLYSKNGYSLDLMLPEFIELKKYIHSKKNNDFIKTIFNFNKDVAKRLFGNLFLPGLASAFYFKEFILREKEFLNLLYMFISTIDLSFAKINLLEKDKFCIPKIINSSEIYLNIKDMFIPNYAIDKRINNEVNLNKENKNMIIVAPFGSGKTTYLTNIMLALYFSELGIAPASSLEYTYFFKIIDLIDTSYKILHDDFSNHMNERRLVKKAQSKIENLKAREYCFIIADELYSGTSKANAYDETQEDIPSILTNENVFFIMSTHNDDYINFIKNPLYKTGLYYSVVEEDPMDKENFILRYKVIPDDKYNWWLNPSKNMDIYRRYRRFMDKKSGIDKKGIY